MPPSSPSLAVTPPAPAPRQAARPVRAALTVVALVLAGLAAAYAISERVDPVYGGSRKRHRALLARAADVEAIVYGNSHGRAIDLRALGLAGAHQDNARADFYEVLHLARATRPALPNLRYVFLPISPFTYDNTASPDLIDRRKWVYVTTGNYRAASGDWDVVFKALLAPVVRSDNWEGVLRGLAARPSRPRGGGHDGAGRAASPQPGPRQQPTRPPRPAAPARAPTLTPAQIERNAAWRAGLHRDLETTSRAADPDLCANARAAIREILDVLAPAHVVLYTPPFSPAYLRHRDETLGCGLDRFAAELAASPNVSYFDHHALEGFTDESGYFRDADHLNGLGARVYSERLAAHLGLSPAASEPAAAR